jgi:(E)-4-hydroxy-3-methylbut-2-enyl-diphosphate synthase
MIIINIKRRKSKVVKIGNLKIGGLFPVSVQSMTNLNIKNTKSTIKQIKQLEEAGCDLVRIAIPDIEACRFIPNIKKHLHIPVMADIHFSYPIAIEAIKNNADGIRINPGNIKQESQIINIIEEARKKNILIRFGINAGSLDNKILQKYNEPNYKAMVEQTEHLISFLKKVNYYNVILSIKSSNVLDTIKANQIIAKMTDYPLHIGITEAGFDRNGITKSAIGIGILLYEGIGDTIRVSLSGNPIQEVLVGHDILRSLGIRNRGINIVSCPTCGRCNVNIHEIAKKIEVNLKNIHHPLTIAIMGCVVNGPGEARTADAGIAFNNQEAMIYKKGSFVGRYEIDDSIKKLLEIINSLCDNRLNNETS